MKKLVTAILAGIMTFSISMTAFAGWQTGFTGDGARWYYVNADGTWATNGWQWIDGKCYCFDENGWVYTATTTPDGYTVNPYGEWVVDGVVQTQDQPTEAVDNNGGGSTGSSESEFINSDGLFDYRSYGYTKGVSNLLLEIPFMSREEVANLLGGEKEVEETRIDTTMTYNGIDAFFSVTYKNGQFNQMVASYDIAFEGLSESDVKNDRDVSRIASYLRSVGQTPNVFGRNESISFKTEGTGDTVQISSGILHSKKFVTVVIP